MNVKINLPQISASSSSEACQELRQRTNLDDRDFPLFVASLGEPDETVLPIPKTPDCAVLEQFLVAKANSFRIELSINLGKECGDIEQKGECFQVIKLIDTLFCSLQSVLR